jgi:hypothetical protein
MQESNLNSNTEGGADKEKELEDLRTKLQKFRLKEANQNGNMGHTDGDIPLIKTFENDISNQIKNNDLSRLDIKSRELSGNSHIISLAENTKSKTKYFYIFIALLSLILIAISSYFGYEYYLKSKKVEPIKIEVKRFFINDVWPSTSRDQVLKTNTSDATSTNDYIVVDIVNFEKVYSYLLQNENKIEGIAKGKFSYSNLGDFQDATVENIDMRIADCTEGTIIYGYVDKNKLLIANDLGKYIKEYKKLRGVQ